ncbi:saccharopine dehydrogenase NADP-binding domain-containing protein [Qipengyuania sp. GH1]|uniref:saccharopine dehydrogenase family protein n=1 Tax=Qipengyuania aestuarii TaxID=2867241 RepID=UPI001C86BFE7|nr:saccharopine dehydrogenase NADP-binding domain-containing protein [Qipengyuania aestuarii]
MARAPGRPLRVAVIGGYGNFGGYVARALASDPQIELVICGRDGAKARRFAAMLGAANPATGETVDITSPPEEMLRGIDPDLVINMVGPYNGQGYGVARAAISAGAHYCDIADARDFVCGITELEVDAKARGVVVLAGASSVPALTAAYCDAALGEMAELRCVEYGISGAEQANRGAGTVAAVLSYVGEHFTRLRQGRMQRETGWRGLESVTYPELGTRWFSAGNVPDLEIFPQRYRGLTDHRFLAGHEVAPLHFGLWIAGLLRRWRLLPNLARFAPLLVQLSRPFNDLSKGRSGFYMVIEGVDPAGQSVSRRHWIIARSGDGPNIPVIPVILIARKLARGVQLAPGARPCLDVITLDEYRNAFAELDVSWIDE